jgi:two-component system, chemotaxis family, protein-glutamate methylesterase/glutaminase
MNENSRIRVLVVDDSAFMRTALRRMIESDPHLQVIDVAGDGLEAVEKALRIHPDVITLDVEMPRLGGLATLRRIMSEAPCPVLMVSSLTTEGAEVTLEALDLGAFDYVPKPSSYASLAIIEVRDELNAKIRAAREWWRQRSRAVTAGSAAFPAKVVEPIYRVPHLVSRISQPAMVCIGSSTGGPKALQQVISTLSPHLPVPVLVAQHMPPGFTGSFARRLNSQCEIHVKEAEQGEPLEPCSVYIAPAGSHLTPLGSDGHRCVAHLSRLPAGFQHLPSVDVLMTAAAEVLRDRVMGVILTGMGNDGESGMRAIFENGGYTIGQNEATCVVYGMPRACAEAGILHRALPLVAIAREIMNATSCQG